MPDRLYRTFSNNLWSVWRWTDEGWEGLYVTARPEGLDTFLRGYLTARPDTEVTSGSFKQVIAGQLRAGLRGWTSDHVGVA